MRRVEVAGISLLLEALVSEPKVLCGNDFLIPYDIAIGTDRHMLLLLDCGFDRAGL